MQLDNLADDFYGKVVQLSGDGAGSIGLGEEAAVVQFEKASKASDCRAFEAALGCFMRRAAETGEPPVGQPGSDPQ